MRYAQYINKKQGINGHLWQGRFYSCILDEKHLHAAVRYVENNPVRIGLVKAPEEYLWSSAKGHVKGGGDSILCPDSYFHEEIRNWSSYLKSDKEIDIADDIRAKTKLAVTHGEDKFVNKLEKKLGIELTKRKAGRPRKIMSKKGAAAN